MKNKNYKCAHIPIFINRYSYNMYDIFINRKPIKCLNKGRNSFPENSRREEFIINPA